MKRIHLLLLLVAAFCFTAARFDVSQDRKILYEGYIKNNEVKITSVVKNLTRTFKTNPKPEARFALAEAQCVLLTHALGNKKDDLFDRYVDQVEENLQKLIKEEYMPAKSHALLAQVYGFRIAANPWKGVFLGGKSNKQIELALAADKNDPLGWYQRANSYLNAPAAFGGDKEKAVKDFEKAVQLMETQNNLRYNWYYLDMLTWLGIAYQRTDQPQKAVNVFRKALKFAPERAWVKDELLPEALAAVD